MRIYIWRLTGIISLLAILISPLYKSSATSAPPHYTQSTAQDPYMGVIQASYVGTSQPPRALTPTVILPIKNDSSPALRTITPEQIGIVEEKELPLNQLPKADPAKSTDSSDASVVQMTMGPEAMPAPLLNFEGVSNLNGVYPPDTEGDIGPNHYVQWVNLSYAIWQINKGNHTATLVYGPIAGTSLFTGFGGPCEITNDGDPIALYDPLADRWLMSQFALPNYPSGPFYQCIAISQTGDPTGSYYRYQYTWPGNAMNDYPKFGVWPDAYYMTANQFASGTGSWAGAGVAAFNREKMMTGLPAEMVYFNLYSVNSNFGGMLPADFDGRTPPPAGAPGLFAEWDDSAWISPNDALRVWQFHVDWVNPANSTFGLSGLPNYVIPTSNVNPDMCGYVRNCIPQPGTGVKLDAISDRLMYRLQYRNFGSYQTLVSNHTVDATGGDIAGIHWFELRNTGTGWIMNQEGVYQPDSNHRWMGSAAMDHVGDLALGYSVSSGSVYPSVRYAGRLVGDPSGTLPQAEVELIAGTGSQRGTAYRWGDYSMMGVDPLDDCTFWYTQEYIQTTGSVPWRTRIGSFKFPSCTTPTAITLDGRVTDAASAPIEGATIDASSGYTTITDETGHYGLTLEDGAYSLTASKYGYISNTVPGVVVMPPGTRQDFTLTVAPTSTISGVVTDAATGWPLYARLDISGFPGGPVFTNPVTGAYNLPLSNGLYTFAINAMSGGYTPNILPIEVEANAVQDFTMVVDSITCSAPGYSPSSGGACTPIPSTGLVVGSIFDANNGAAIINPSVKDVNFNSAFLIDNSADTSQAHPMYIISEPAGVVSLTANASFYISDTQSPIVGAYNTIRQDFNLEAGVLDASPTNLAFTVTEPTASKLLTLTNSGGAPVNYEVFAIPGIFTGYDPVGPFAVHTRHFGPKNLIDLDASQIRMDLTPLNVPMINGGTVSASWATGLTYAWGIGFNNDAADLWLGNLLTAEGDGFNYRFTTDGVNTGDRIDTSSWVSSWNADMTYNPFTNMLWQVKVGSDSCIYELDPATKTSTGNRICPAFGTSERGLAFDPLTNTYYAGSWNDGIINHFAPDGTLIDSASVNLNISGLAFNPSTGHLFAMTSNKHPEKEFDVYALDTQNAYDILGGFNITDGGVDVFTTGGQAGLEIDCSGKLWAVDQFSQKVYVADSGETSVCNWDTKWLSAVPTTGDVPVGDNVSLKVNVDATTIALGTHQAYLRVVSDTPYGDQIIPIILKVVNSLRFFLPVINR